MRYAGIEIHVSDKCNRSCWFCTFGQRKSGEMMTSETALRVLNIWKDKTDTVTFSGGGEPTTNNRILRLLIDTFTWHSVKCGLITNGWQTPDNANPLEWIRLSVYSPNCAKEIANVQRADAFKHNAALFYRGMHDLKRYLFLLREFDEVTVKTLNEGRRLTDEECMQIQDLGFKCKQNAKENDFAACQFAKPTIGVRGEVYRCCLCKAQGVTANKSPRDCLVPCVMYNSNKAGEIVKNAYGFPI